VPHRKKRPSEYTRKMKHRVATELYSFPHEKENIDKTFKKMERWSSEPFPGSEVDYARGMY
jgi:hypothetical protein